MTPYFGYSMTRTWNVILESAIFVSASKVSQVTHFERFNFFGIWYPFLDDSYSWLLLGIWHLRVSYSCSVLNTTLVYRFLKFCYLTPYFGFNMTHTWNMTLESVIFLLSVKNYIRLYIIDLTIGNRFGVFENFAKGDSKVVLMFNKTVVLTIRFC